MRRLVVLVLIACFATTLLAQGPKLDSDRLVTPHGADAGQIAVARQRIADSLRQNATDSPAQVVVVYFTPKDRDPAANHTARVRRIVEEVSKFYREELTRHGFTGRNLNVLLDADGQILVTDVIGESTDENYGKSDGGRIRGEIVSVLRANDIDPDSSVLLMFCNLMDYDAKKGTIAHHSPYYGGGSHTAGNAWQCDSEILDPLRLNDPTPIRDGEYGRITIGRHNSIFIGGVIHELGHALSLPHCRQRPDEAVRGTALMGSGNRTFAEERRGEGRGTFLTQAHALRLAAHPAFNARAHAMLHHRADVTWDGLRIDAPRDNTIRIRGEVQASVPVHSVVAYFDPAGRSNYDATTATAIPDDEAKFVLISGPLRSGVAAQLRLVACHVNGTTTTKSMQYFVDAQGHLDLSTIRLELELEPMIDELRRNDVLAANSALDRLAKDDETLKQIGERVVDRFRVQRQAPAPASIAPASLPASAASVPLSRLKPVSANVGWIRPTYDRVPDRDLLLSIGGDYFANGIYAHAPAKHQYQLDGNWKRLAGQCGMQSNHPGKVDFEIIGDGRLLWSQRGVTDGVGIPFDIDIEGVGELALIVTDGGNGTAADWGVWIEPTLSR